MTHSKVIRPPTQDRIDLVDHLPHWLADVSPEDLPQLCKQRCPLFQLRRVIRPPHPVTAEYATIFKAQLRETSAFRRVASSPFVLFYPDSEFTPSLPHSSFHRPDEPVMPPMRVDQYHQIIRKTCILDGGVFSVARGSDRFLQHPVHLSEIEVAEHWRNHPALWNALFPSRFQNHLEQPHHCRILHPSRYLFEQQRVLHVIKIGAEVDVNDSGFLFDNRLSHSVHRLMCCSLRPVSVRSRLKISFKDRLQDQLECSLAHPIPYPRNPQTAYLPPSFRNFLLPCRHGPIRVGDQFIPDLPEKGLRSAFLNGSKRDPVNSGRPVVAFRHLVGVAKCLHLADVDV